MDHLNLKMRAAMSPRPLASALLSLVAVLAGCSSAPGSEPALGSTRAANATPARTIVHIGTDGKQRIASAPFARSGGLKPADACPGSTCDISVDPACADADFWMFDEADYAGNELCVFVDVKYGVGFPSLDLTTAPRGELSWSGAIRSWGAGQTGGAFATDNDPVSQGFFAWAYEAKASPYASSATTLYLNGN